ncbi:MAG: cadherin-like domain-containing protein, partial [Pseudomonadota bacterium]
MPAATLQAQNDNFLTTTTGNLGTGITEDNLSTIVTLDVKANDDAAATATIWSLDSTGGLLVNADGTLSSSNSPLKAQDAVGVAQFSRLGATIKITSATANTAKVSYDASTIDAAVKASFQKLGAGEFTTDSFTYAIKSTAGTYSWATATVQISGVNDIPVLTGTKATLAAGIEDTSYTISASNLLAGFTDIDANDTVLSVANLSVDHGTVTTNANGTWTFTPAANYNGAVSLTYNVIDSHGGSAATTQSFNLTAVNDAPLLTGTPAVLAAGAEDSSYIIQAANLLAGFTDVDGDTLSIANLSANHGALVNNGNGSWTFTPAANYNGAVSLTYNVVDGHGGSVATTQSFNLTAVNDAPLLTGTPAVLAAGAEDSSYIIQAANLLAGFTDVDGDTLSIANLSANHGALVNNGNGSWTFTPAANYNGAVSLTYNVVDGYGGSTVATQTFNLTAVNDAPILTGTPAVLTTGTEDSSYIIQAANLLTGFSDIDGDTLSIANLSANHGTVVDNGNGTFTVTPAADYNGAVNLSYQVVDGHSGEVSATQSFTLNTVNDAPVLTGTAAVLAAGTEDVAYTIQASDLLAGFSDVDGDTLSVADLSANHGTVIDNGNGTFTVTPAPNYSGTVNLSYQVVDGHGGEVSATQSFTLNAVNDAPVLTGTAAVLAAGTEDISYTVQASDLLAGFSDVDGDTLSVAGLSANHGTVVDNGNGTFTVTPAADYNGAVNLSYQVVDGHGGEVS